jgi:LmbE family N-acetylglucosaminyl deacetylase
MRARVGKDKLSLALLLCVLMGSFVLGPLGSVFAEFDEPPQGTEPAGTQPTEPTMHRDGNTLRGRAMDAEGSLDPRESDRETAMMDNLRRGVLLSVSWIFLVVGLILVALTLRRTYIWLTAVRKARVPPTRYFNLQLQVRGRDGDLGLHNFDYYPVVVAATGTADLLLPDVADSRARFRIDYRQGQAHLLSDSSIIVNGVPRQKKALKQDDRIIFGPYRLMFKDASIREQSAPIPGMPVFVWQFPIVALLLALSILFKQAGAVSEDTILLAKAAELQAGELRAGELRAAELRAAELQSVELQSAGQHSAVAAGTEQSSEQLESLAAAEVAHERVPLIQKLRWLFNGRSTEEVRFAETEAPRQRLADVSVERPVNQEYAAAQRPQVQSPQVQEPQANEPQAQKPAGVAVAKADSALKQTAPEERINPRSTEGLASSVPSKMENQLPPSAVEDATPSSRKVVLSQPLPVRRPVPSREPPIETAAVVPAPRSIDTSPVKEEASTPSRRSETPQPPVLQASVLGTIAPPGVQNKGINPLEGLSFAKARTAPEIGRVKVRVIPPGRQPEYFKADILFIHAHPDDESIDFGSLMAKASRSNKRIVTLLFTDGESGLDLYPERKVGDIYPARDLTGKALSQVRVVEATRALSILGSEMYVRWGLVNRPYNTKRDEVPPDEVIRGWGGEDLLVEKLIEVLEGFRPTIVVSPDRHSKAYEHFEHEAVGQLVQTALERLRRDEGKSFVRGYLVSIDPYQADRYSGVTNVDAQARDGESGLAYRSIQALALKEHVTQRDASVIGVNRLSHLPEEFYKVLYWDLDLSIEEYLK